MIRTPSLLATLLASAFLVACGGDDDNDSDRGLLVDSPTSVTTLSKAAIDAGTTSSGLIALTGAARCDVSVIALNYNTRGPGGQKTNASGALLIPSGAGCTGAAPLVAYAKGTDVQKPRTLANASDGETFLLMAMYAAQGYAVVATDYLGFAKSSFPYHPYLHADSEAASVIDAIRAARIAAPSFALTLSGKVMFTGYSQGGHSSSAAQRAAERDNAGEFNVVAGAHLAGPYNLSGSTKSPVVIAGYQFFVPYLVTAYQKVYGDVYTDVNAVFKPPYAAGIENLLPSPTLTYTTLITTGALPTGATPTIARDALFQAAFINDVLTNPNNKLVLDTAKNDLLGWTPKAKTLLCGGAGDPTVPPGIHRDVLYADMIARGVPTSIISKVDVDASIQFTYGPNHVAPTDPSSAAYANYYGNYHGSYEPPFCHAQARALFDTVK